MTVSSIQPKSHEVNQFIPGVLESLFLCLCCRHQTPLLLTRIRAPFLTTENGTKRAPASPAWSGWSQLRCQSRRHSSVSFCTVLEVSPKRCEFGDVKLRWHWSTFGLGPSRCTLWVCHQGGLSIVPSCCFTSRWAKRLSLALNILPCCLFLILLFFKFRCWYFVSACMKRRVLVVQCKVNWLTYGYQALMFIIVR